MTHFTCRLTAKNRNQLRSPTLGNRVWATFTFFKQDLCTSSGVIIMCKQRGNESVPIQLAQCWFPGLAISTLKYKYICSHKIYGNNFIKQHSETVMVRNYQNADCSLKKINFRFIYYNFRHNSHGVVPYVVYILIDQLTQRIDLTSSVTCRRHDSCCTRRLYITSLLLWRC